MDVDAKRMFKHACGFYDCASFCEHEPKNIKVSFSGHMIADIVNSAFACEVFIKSLLVSKGKNINEIKGHKLKDLWNKYRECNSSIASDFEKNVMQYFNTTNESFFDESLENISNAFEKWRYIYEIHGAKIHINFLRVFRLMLRELCCEELYGMTWEEYSKFE